MLCAGSSQMLGLVKTGGLLGRLVKTQTMLFSTSRVPDSADLG